MSYPPPQGYGAPGGYPPQGGYAPPATNGKATGALITGLIGVFCFPILFLVAIPLGFMGLSTAKKINGVGRGAAIGGLIAGFVALLESIAIVAVLVIAAANADDVIDSASCGIDRIQLETAATSFQAREGRLPNDEAELVSAGDLSNEVSTYDLEPGTTNAVAVSGEGCD
jgi:hypothetical protein